MPAVPRMLFVHAHPDDETISNGVTIARYAAEGAEVTVVTCTLGEEGEIIGDRWAQLGAHGADQLGGYRIGELTAALGHLGLDAPVFLGGAGCWRDSGLVATPERGRTRFVDAGSRAVDQLGDIIAELRPHVVVTYDPGGGYGHPDHVQAHRITVEAIAAAAGRWRVPKFYWTVMSAAAFRSGIDALGPDDVRADWIWPGEMPFGFTDEQITTVIDAPEHLAAKVSAIAAHATQMTMGPSGRAFALSNKLILPVLGQEHYILAGGTGDPSGPEDDLLAGVSLADG